MSDHRRVIEDLLEAIRQQKITSTITIQTSQGAITNVYHNLKII